MAIAELEGWCLIKTMDLKFIPIYLLLFAEVCQAQLLFKFDGKVTDSINGYYTIGQSISISLTTQADYVQKDVITDVNQNGANNGYWYTNIKGVFSNISGTQEVIKFCLDNKIKIIYSATSASLGNNQDDQHLSPYAYSKSVNMNLIVNLKKWFNLLILA